MALTGLENRFVKSWGGWDTVTDFSMQFMNVEWTDYSKKIIGDNWPSYDIFFFDTENFKASFYSSAELPELEIEIQLVAPAYEKERTFLDMCTRNGTE
ncbi:hypothetical protein NVP1121O_248 [Vibrio phage 1.121.O._10N.286.46.C4]|nr:hypothetical protein NVP1121O_248 [Vibrio phage 1.121.O._10N.286.46.C4]